jgi:transposase
MQTITTIGLDIAKSVFQVHGVDAEGKVIIRRQLKRRYVLAFFLQGLTAKAANGAATIIGNSRQNLGNLECWGCWWF